MFGAELHANRLAEKITHLASIPRFIHKQFILEEDSAITITVAKVERKDVTSEAFLGLHGNGYRAPRILTSVRKRM